MSTRIQTRFTREYRVEHPIALAGMAFVGTAPNLAIAVCEAGGVGSIGVGPLPGKSIRKLIREVRSATDRPLNANFITFLATEQQIQVCIEEAVDRVLPLGPSPARIHKQTVYSWD